MFSKEVFLGEGLDLLVKSYKVFWDQGKDGFPPPEPRTLWVPQFGWVGGRFCDGPLLYEGRVVIGRGGGYSLNLASAPHCEDDYPLVKDDLVESLVWSVRFRLRDVFEGRRSDAICLNLDQLDQVTSLRLVLLRKAFRDTEICVLNKDLPPPWRRLLQNLGVRFQKGLSGVTLGGALADHELFPKIPHSLVHRLVEQVQGKTQVIPYQLLRNFS